MTPEIPPVYLHGEVGRALTEERVRNQEWFRVRRGACSPVPTGETWERDRQRGLAHAVAAQRQISGSVVSDLSAALVHGLAVWVVPDVPTLILPRNPRSGLPRDVRRRVCRLEDDDVIEIAGVRVTTLPRTMLDCARSRHPRDALVVVDSGLRALVQPKRYEPRADIEARAAVIREALLARIAPRSRGAVQARAIIEASDPLAEQAPESVMRWIAISRGMPRPTLQKQVTTSRGTFFTDMAWPFQRDGRPLWYHIEFDGSSKYRADPQGRTTADVLLDERKRESSISATRDEVLRIYSDEITREDHVFGRITEPLAQSVVARYRRVPALYRPPHT